MSSPPDLTGSWNFQLSNFIKVLNDGGTTSPSGVLTGSVQIAQSASGDVTFMIPVNEDPLQEEDSMLAYAATWVTVPQYQGANSKETGPDILVLKVTVTFLAKGKSPSPPAYSQFLLTPGGDLSGTWTQGAMLLTRATSSP